jgi:hypothetical protein
MATSLSEYFTGIAAKRLSNVEINSNQHEFNGVNEFRKILGEERKTFSGYFIYLPDDEEDIVSNKGTLTWYDVRENNPARSAEFRLYYSDSEIIPDAAVEDLVIMGKNTSDELVVIVSPKGSTSEKQLLWLFGLEEVENKKFVVRDFRDNKDDIGFAGKYILESLGITVEETAPDYLEDMIGKFGLAFPPTKIFSEYCRSTVKDVSVKDAPDQALIAWWDREGLLLRTFEAEIIKERLKKGFAHNTTGVDDFISFSLSVLNRRKSRAGHSFENHLEVVFNAHDIRYSKGAKTERNNKPDFIFPDIASYHTAGLDTGLLTMLGVKTTLKDRWRQILTEAEKITHKHLITMEPAISRNQTNEILESKLQLVIPAPLISTFLPDQQQHLMPVSDFLALVKKKQAVCYPGGI